MSSRSKRHPSRVLAMLSVVATIVCTFATLAAAQDPPAPKWELYGGYSAFYAGCDMNGLLPGGAVPVRSCLKWDPRGLGATVTYDFNRWLGVTVDSSGQWGSGNTGVASRIDQVEFFNLSAGPKITFRSHYFSPFLEALAGEHRLASEVFGNDYEPGFMAGGGLDWNLKRHFAIRLFRADFVFSNHQYGPSSIVPATDVRGVRLQSGVVFLFGPEPAGPPVSASCAIQPGEVIVGEPATATASGSNFNPRHMLNYTWTSTGGAITGKDSTASLDTNGMAGGSYTVTAHISDPQMKGGEASCMATFAVKEPPKNPPVFSCFASPSNVQLGGFSTINCTCSSPDNAAITVGSWSASGGNVASGGGGSASLDTSGASAGAIMVSASCSDSRGLNTPATAQVIVENPPPPSPEFVQLETRLALHSIYFPTAQPRVENPGGGLLDSQEQTLIPLAEDFKKYLETKPDAHLTLGGHADPRASVEYNQALSERRVERVKAFLIEHGVPAASLETKAFGEERNLSEAEVKDAVERNPELTPEQRQRVLDHLQTIVLASNRRVDITLSTTGQRSVRQYPFNAADSLTLLQQEATKKTARPAATKKVKATARE